MRPFNVADMVIALICGVLIGTAVGYYLYPIWLT